jgi:protein-disulfide isomerase
MPQSLLDRAATAAIIVAALAVAVRQSRSPDVAPVQGASLAIAPRLIPQWRDVHRDAIPIRTDVIGPVVIEFSDFECPFCARFHHEFSLAGDSSAPRFTHAFLHFPLPMHRFAHPAAVAAECAFQQDRFARFKDVVFSRQDSLGLVAWRELAERADVPDVEAYERCRSDSSTDSMVRHRSRWSEALRIEGTPAVLIDSTLYVGLSADSIRRIIHRRFQEVR